MEGCRYFRRAVALTPTWGIARFELARCLRLTGDPILLRAARETAAALLRGQLQSGGWDNKIEFSREERRKYAYRVDGDPGKKRNTTTFDDDKSQSAIRFLMNLDRELEFNDESIHEATMYALDGVLRSQYPGGAWPQRFGGELENPDPESRKARFPEKWSREYPGTRYDRFYTLND